MLLFNGELSEVVIEFKGIRQNLSNKGKRQNSVQLIVRALIFNEMDIH